jgi:hypothetical protein
MFVRQVIIVGSLLLVACVIDAMYVGEDIWSDNRCHENSSTIPLLNLNKLLKGAVLGGASMDHDFVRVDCITKDKVIELGGAKYKCVQDFAAIMASKNGEKIKDELLIPIGCSLEPFESEKKAVGGEVKSGPPDFY